MLEDVDSGARTEAQLAANRALWNELVAIHARSAFYNLEGFLAGKSSLKDIEVAELGDVRGKSLLHLQCHFGMDTLSWARLGARVTGVDFSEKAIALAHSLSEQLGLEARFFCGNVYDLPDILQDRFDIVFTSYGVLLWLPDLTRWAEVIAHFLKPGGTFYIVEIHPFARIFDDREDARELKVAYPYFQPAEPSRFEDDGSYADRSAKLDNRVSYEWGHTLAEILNAVASAGLHIESFREYPKIPYQILPFAEKAPDGWWRLPESDSIPLLFSIQATK
jgi:SAM-dependent methyltransferase